MWEFNSEEPSSNKQLVEKMRKTHLLQSWWLVGLCLFSTLVFAQSYDPALYSSLEWRSIGPYRGGRSAAVTGVPGKPNLYYFGAAGGGVWKTQDGGQTWVNISDGYFGGSIGAVAVSESDPNVIYVGGGRSDGAW
jgi:hypothetical protein